MIERAPCSVPRPPSPRRPAAMPATAALALCAAASLASAGCIAPMIEAGAGPLLAIDRGGTHEVGEGYRSFVAAGVTPTDRAGPFGRLEVLGTYDSVRATEWSTRLHGGWSFALPHDLAIETGADVGTRVDGGIFMHTFEPGLRGAFVLPLTPVRTPQDRSDAFVFVSRNVDLSIFGRVGWQLAHGSADAAEASGGLSLRIWAISDLL